MEFKMNNCFYAIKEVSQEEYEELKSMLITAIGTMELMRRNK